MNTSSPKIILEPDLGLPDETSQPILIFYYLLMKLLL